MYIGNLHL